jgi:hypothetical protein
MSGALEIADAVFPTAYGSEDPAYKALRRHGVKRVFAAITWMRAQGVAVVCLPSDAGAVFVL